MTVYVYQCNGKYKYTDDELTRNHAKCECGEYHPAEPTTLTTIPHGFSVRVYKPKWSQIHKTWLTSAKQEDRLDASRGIATITDREAKAMTPEADKPKAISYRGKKDGMHTRGRVSATAHVSIPKSA